MEYPSSTSSFDRFLHAYLRHRYAILFFSLLSSFVLLPTLSILKLSSGIAEVYFAATLLTAIAPIARVGLRRFLLALLVASWLGNITGSLFYEKNITAIGFVVSSMVALFTAAHGLKYALSGTRVEREHIFAALSAYLLAGIFIGHFYWILQQIWPGSIQVSGAGAQVPFSISHAIYFSFITLATVGYGDIVPFSPVARGLAVIEAVAGQMYLGVMVARLIGVYSTKKREEGE